MPDHDHVDPVRRQLTRLKWLTTLLPPLAVMLYETVRHQALDPLLPAAYGNLIVALLTLVLAYGFSEAIFRVVGRLQDQALAQSREVATLTAVMQERERLSRELHDGLAQLVSYLLVRLDTVADLLRNDRRPEAAEELERLRSVADDLYVDVRESIVGLRSRVADRGLVPALEDYLDQFEERHGVSMELRAGHLPGELPSLAGLQLFRIVQEALANVRKHANATRATISLAIDPAGHLELVVADDGRGFDPAAASDSQRSYGLTSMRERAESLGGHCRIESRPGGGTRVIVTIPLAEHFERVANNDLARATG